MTVLQQDLRYAARMLLRRPGLTVAVVMTMALGIGANAAIFSLVYGIMLKPFPFAGSDRVVRVFSFRQTAPERQGPLSVPEMEELRTRSKSFADAGVFEAFDTNLGSDSHARSVQVCWITPGLFQVTGVAPMLGRAFTDADEGVGADPHKLILSHDIWRNMFGGDPAVIGRTVRMRLLTYTIVGVMPPGYSFPARAEIWAPLRSWLSKFEVDARADWNWRSFSAIARLRPGISAAQAASELEAIGAQLEREHPVTNKATRFRLVSLRTAEVGEIRPYLVMLSVAAGCVLLICCVNIANLLVARMLGRRKEFALRAAIGAGRARLLRQLVTESVVLAVPGGLVGLGFAYAAVQALAAIIPARLPAWVTIEMNWTVLWFGLGITLLTGLAFGLLPAIEAARFDLQSFIRSGSGGSSRTSPLHKGLIVAEVALSLVLLIVSGLMIKTFLLLYTAGPGFQPKNVLTAFISPHRVGTPAELTEAYWTIYHRAMQTLANTPGVLAVGGATGLPYARDVSEGARGRFRFRRRTDQEDVMQFTGVSTEVSPGYFAAMGIPIVAGRDFTDADSQDRECVMVISTSAATNLWPGTPAVGEALRLGNPQNPWCRVIGVVGTIRFSASDDDDTFQIYYSYRQREAGSFYLVARTTGNPMRYAGALRNAVTAGDRETGVIFMKSMESLMGDSLWRRRLWGVLLGAFATLALVLAAVGIHGVLAQSMRRRTKEIGIRMALGASRTNAVTLVCREAALAVGAGIALGLACAVATAKTLSAMLFRVAPYDPAIFIAMPLVLVAIAALASLLPARRAASVDAAIALRHEE